MGHRTPVKRLRSGIDSPVKKGDVGRFSLSQPVPDALKEPKNDSGSGDTKSSNDVIYSFSQPEQPENMFLATQMSATQCSSGTPVSRIFH